MDGQLARRAEVLNPIMSINFMNKGPCRATPGPNARPRGGARAPWRAGTLDPPRRLHSCICNQPCRLPGGSMPAVTADPLTLPRITAPSAEAVERRVRSVTTAPRGFEGEGFP